MTTDATCYVWLTVAPGDRHTGQAGTGLCLDRGGASGYVMHIRYWGDAYANYTVVEGFEIKDATSSGGDNSAIALSADYVTVRNMLIYNTATYARQGDGIYGHGGNGSDYCLIYNNIV